MANIYRLDGSGFVQVHGQLEQIVVNGISAGVFPGEAYASFVWGLNNSNQIFRYNESAFAFEQVPGIMTNISVGTKGDVWGVNSSDQIFVFVDNFAQIPGQLRLIAVGNGIVWGINASGQIFQYDGTGFIQVAGSLQTIVAGGNEVWGLNSSGQTFRYADSSFQRIPGNLKTIALNQNSLVWGINESEEIFYFRGDTFTQVPGQLNSISVGFWGPGPQPVWGLNSAGQIFQLRDDFSGFVQVSGPKLSSIAVAAPGIVWGLGA
jgi:virginiamycin B lyase